MRRRLAVATATQAEFVSNQRIFSYAGRFAVWASPACMSQSCANYMPKNSGFTPSAFVATPEADEPACTPPKP